MNLLPTAMTRVDPEKIIKDILRTKLFSTLTKRQAKKLFLLGEEQTLKEGDILFHQSDPSDSLFILVAGTLQASLCDERNNRSVVGLICSGEIVGDLGLFTDKPRSLTIKAKTKSVVMRFNREDTYLFLKKYATTDFWYNLLNLMATRSQAVIKQLSKESLCNHVAIIAANTGTDTQDFINQLKATTSQKHSIYYIDNDYLEQNQIDISIGSLSTLMIEADKKGSTLVFIIPDIESLQKYLLLHEPETLDINHHHNNYFFNNIGALLIITYAKTEVKVSDPIKSIIDKNLFPLIKKRELVLYHRESNHDFPENTKAWLDQFDFTHHHHIRNNYPMDFKRLLRFMIGKPNALVLGGGGSKGWASLGVIKACEYLKIPIDVIGGTSSGALLAGLWAIHSNIRQIEKASLPIKKAYSNLFSLQNLCYPVISINNGKAFTKALRSMYGNHNIEDLWVSYFSISCNLNTGGAACHTNGALWESIRASCSIPLIFPPFVRKGQLHVDGGLLNNLPVDVMREKVGKDGFIIAVDLMLKAMNAEYNFPPDISLVTSLRCRLSHRQKEYIYPPLFESFIRALTMASSEKRNTCKRMANIILQPDLPYEALFSIDSEVINELINIGFEYSINELEQLSLDHETGILG